MATRKPLVLVSGQVQQLQSGDTLSGPFADQEGQAWTNGDSVGHTVGQVVYVSGNDTVKKAKADAGSTVPAVAFANGSIANGAVGTYLTSGVISGLSGLVADTVYYLDDATAGGMVSAAPSTAGHYVQELGVAISTTELLIRIRAPILL